MNSNCRKDPKEQKRSHAIYMDVDRVLRAAESVDLLQTNINRISNSANMIVL